MNTPADTTLVCFDLGGVLVRICRSWAEGCTAAGVELRDPDRFAAPHLKDIRRDLSDQHQRGEITPDQFFAGVSQHTDGLYAPHEIQRVHHAWILGEYPGVAELLRTLNALPHVVTACLSNTNAAHWDALLQMPAVASLDHRFASQELGAIKPHHDAYLAVQRATNHEPRRIVFFDDLPPNVEAARELGWDANLIDHADDTAEQIRAALRHRRILD